MICDHINHPLIHTSQLFHSRSTTLTSMQFLYISLSSYTHHNCSTADRQLSHLCSSYIPHFPHTHITTVPQQINNSHIYAVLIYLTFLIHTSQPTVPQQIDNSHIYAVLIYLTFLTHTSQLFHSRSTTLTSMQFLYISLYIFNWKGCFRFIILCLSFDKMALSFILFQHLYLHPYTSHIGALTMVNQHLNIKKINYVFTLLSYNKRMSPNITLKKKLGEQILKWSIFAILTGLLHSHSPYIINHCNSFHYFIPFHNIITVQVLFHNLVTLKEGHGLSNWYQAVDVSHVYHHNKFERNWYISIQMQANVNGLFYKNLHVKLSSLNTNCVN